MPLNDAEVRKNLHFLAAYDEKRSDELQKIQRNAIAKFKGSFDDLEAAIGVLHLGDHIGWKPMVIIHNKRTIRKYEEILGIKMREFFVSEGPSANRSIGYRIAKNIGNFWKAVSGEIKDDDLKAHRRSMG